MAFGGRPSLYRNEKIWGLIMVAPTMLGIGIFFYIALGASFLISLSEWTALSRPVFLGFRNYRTIVKDPILYRSLFNTVKFVLLNVPAGMILALGISLLLNSGIRLKNTYRLLYFMPYLTLPVALAVVWKWMFNPAFGFFNLVLKAFRLSPVDWLGNTRTALVSIVFYSIVTGIGYGIVLLLAGLNNIPHQYYEAATMDGASVWQRFRHITLPLLTPTIFFQLVTNTIWSFQVFDQVFIMTRGGPADSTRTIMFSVYQEGFKYFRFGTAAAVSWLLFMIIMIITLIQLAGQKKWVHYE